mmetsp:Transcript_27878/g.28147  ORF Transcript_27878/g.28147 Transcript_27878/m.28147 type:complete len:348 (+) Transcript_27878:233-1276(+)|eukprot:CAMPEP_0182431564 /NCGR_PEP_ID=MMETSP1167-20130531/50153_1 /TAXON_ID=2988 /ORGANISM="Mallomonas Sp, Strain CCMP3275" /LENGTH=347 /DNA_ID=CAMNT_0024618045 /DNA_START=146 /DNA_END=1189 /DNA_ORIENTATION=-
MDISKEKTLTATDIIPNLYDSSALNSLDVVEDKVDDLTYDIYNLVCCDYHTLRVPDDENCEATILQAAARATQLLVKKIFECPTESSLAGPLAILPEPIFVLPREKRIPEPKPLTKWERFAQEKNIKNRKKERMLYDESTGEYRPRFGYKGMNRGIEDQPIVEVKDGQDPYANPWEENRKTKKERVQKNMNQQIKNMSRGKDGKIIKTYDPSSVPGIPLELTGEGKRRGKEGLKTALQLVQHSTASMGRYDVMRKGEPDRKIKGKKRSFKENFSGGDLSSEKSQMKAQLRIVSDKIDKKNRGVTNSLAAYEGIIPDAPSDSFRQKKGRGKNSGRTDSEGPKKKKVKR